MRRERLKIRVELCFALFSPPPLLFETVTRLYVLLSRLNTHTILPYSFLPTSSTRLPRFGGRALQQGLSMGQCLRARWGGDLAARAEGQGSSYRKVKQVLPSFLLSNTSARVGNTACSVRWDLCRSLVLESSPHWSQILALAQPTPPPTPTLPSLAISRSATPADLAITIS